MSNELKAAANRLLTERHYNYWECTYPVNAVNDAEKVANFALATLAAREGEGRVYIVTVHYHYDDTDIDSVHATKATAEARCNELKGDYAGESSVDIDVLEMKVTQAKELPPCTKSP